MKELKPILICLQVTTVLFLGTMIALVSQWAVYRHSLIQPKEQTVCVKNVFNTEEVSCDASQCCGPVSQILTLLNEASVAEMYNDEGHPDNIDISIHMRRCVELEYKPNHLELNHVKSYAGRSFNEASKLYWESPASGLAGSGLKYVPADGSVYIETPGLYYISSHLTLIVENKTSEFGDKSDRISHSVVMVLHLKREEKVVLGSEKSPCNMHAEESQLTSSLGGVFRLDARDRVYTAVSHPEKISTDGGRNTFQMYRLADL